MKLFDKLFRRSKVTTNDVTTTPTNVQKCPAEESRAQYYVNLLNNHEKLEAMTEEIEFVKAIEDIPSGKVAVFFNIQFLIAAKEKDFVALDEYIESAKQNKEQKAFYRGVFHGPCVIFAFRKSVVPNDFDGSCFLSCPTSVLYL